MLKTLVTSCGHPDVQGVWQGRGRQQAGGRQSQRVLLGAPKWCTPGFQLPHPRMGQCTHHVEVLLIVAAQQKEEVGTGLVQQRVLAQLGEKPPQLPHPQRGVCCAEQKLQKQRARLISCWFLFLQPSSWTSPTSWSMRGCAARGTHRSQTRFSFALLPR